MLTPWLPSLIAASIILLSLLVSLAESLYLRAINSHSELKFDFPLAFLFNFISLLLFVIAVPFAALFYELFWLHLLQYLILLPLLASLLLSISEKTIKLQGGSINEAGMIYLALLPLIPISLVISSAIKLINSCH